MMYKRNKIGRTSIVRNESYIGETIEQKINRIVNNKEPISDGAPLIYTDRKEGVLPGYDIRTDRFDVAIEAMDKVTASNRAKREAKIIEMEGKEGGKKAEKTGPEGNKSDGGPESIQGTK